jgi:head-tail adaptor
VSRAVPRLDRALTLEAPVRSPDGAGGFMVTWQALGTHWAELRPGTGRERSGRAVTLSRSPYRIIVRGAPVGSPARPQPDQRFREGDRIFAILAVTEADPSGRYLTCHAEEETVA